MIFSISRGRIREYAVYAIGIFVLFSGAAGIVYVARPDVMQMAQENSLFFLMPTDERAFTYGEHHFNARDASDYDVNRAQYFFNQARLLNPKHPFVYHELARIAFLKGDQDMALSLINTEFLVNAYPSPSSYYVRALIKAYRQDYKGAAADYELYFKATPATWGSINDYAWVLMKMGFYDAALDSLNWGLTHWPENAWLLSNKATALYELRRYNEAKKAVTQARVASDHVVIEDWLTAYPGNDPLSAPGGLASFKKSVADNGAKIDALQKETGQ